MAVNISAIQLREENFVDRVFAIFKETGMDPKLLEVELTESVLMKHAGTPHPFSKHSDREESR
jgi:diguanylate cyclase